MIHKDINERWLQEAIDAAILPESISDLQAGQLPYATLAIEHAGLAAQIASAMALIRIAEALEKLVEKQSCTTTES